LTDFTEKEIEVFEFLDNLRESGVTNMFGAGSYIKESFPDVNSTKYLSKWMETFEERYPNGD